MVSSMCLGICLCLLAVAVVVGTYGSLTSGSGGPSDGQLAFLRDGNSKATISKSSADLLCQPVVSPSISQPVSFPNRPSTLIILGERTVLMCTQQVETTDLPQYGHVSYPKAPCPVKRDMADDSTTTELPTFGNFPCTKPLCQVKRDGLDDPTTTDLPQYGHFSCSKPPCPVKRNMVNDAITSELPSFGHCPCTKAPCPVKRDAEVVIDSESLVKDKIAKRDTLDNELGHDPCVKPPCIQKHSADRIPEGNNFAGKIAINFKPGAHPSTSLTYPFSVSTATAASSEKYPSEVPRPTKRSRVMPKKESERYFRLAVV